MSAKIHSGDFLSALPQQSSPTTAAVTAAGLFRRFFLLFQELCKIETWFGPPPGATGTRLDLTSRRLEEMLGHRPEVLWPTTFSLSFLSIISISLTSWGPSDLVNTLTWLLNGRSTLKTQKLEMKVNPVTVYETVSKIKLRAVLALHLSAFSQVGISTRKALS